LALGEHAGLELTSRVADSDANLCRAGLLVDRGIDLDNAAFEYFAGIAVHREADGLAGTDSAKVGGSDGAFQLQAAIIDDRENGGGRLDVGARVHHLFLDLAPDGSFDYRVANVLARRIQRCMGLVELRPGDR